MLRDPRHHKRYTLARRAYLAAQPDVVTCCLCGAPVQTRLDGRHPWGPTIEHRMPVRHILATARTNSEALTMALDESLWALAHLRCQRAQGGSAAAVRRKPRASYAPSRDW